MTKTHTSDTAPATARPPRHQISFALRTWGAGGLATAWWAATVLGALDLPNSVVVLVLGLLVALTLEPDHRLPRRGVAITARNVVLAGLVAAAFVPVGGRNADLWAPIATTFWVRRMTAGRQWRNDAMRLGHVEGEPPWPTLPAHLAGLRVLDPNGLSSDTPAGVVASLQAAGVPEADASVFFGGLPSERVTQAGALLLMVSTLVVIFGPRPRRGTRWFWFWLLGLPGGIGVVGYALWEVAGLRAHRAPAPGLRSDGVYGIVVLVLGGMLAGLSTGILLSLVGATVTPL